MGSTDNLDHITIGSDHAGHPDIPTQHSETSGQNSAPLSEKKEKEQNDSRTSPTIKRILYSLTVLAILGGVHHLWMEPIVIQAPFGQTIKTALPDHSIVVLNSGSSITYSRNYGWVNRKVKLNGEAFFTVKGNSRPFIVTTDNGLISARSTKFNVRSWNTDPGEETVVTLIEGKLDFSSKRDPNKSVTLLSGQSSRLSRNHPVPTRPEIANVAHAISWKQNGLSFDAQPLSVIFSEMERRYNILISTTNSQILQDSLTIFIARPTGPRDVLNNICQAANLKYNATDQGYVVSRN